MDERINGTWINRLAMSAAVCAAVAGLVNCARRTREGFASGNGRIEATEVDIASKLGGRVASIAKSRKGDFVSAGDVLASMDTQVLQRHNWPRPKPRCARPRTAGTAEERRSACAKAGRDHAAAIVRQRQARLDAAPAYVRSAALVA